MDESPQHRVVTTTTTTTRRIIRRQVNYNITNGETSYTSSGTSISMSPVSVGTPIADSPLIQSPGAPLEITGSGQVIQSIDISSPHTVEEMDEKRDSVRAYEYLLRLTEVRNWLKECLHSDDIAKEIDLEQNLSNGVLLARLAHTFAPDVVPLSKIFDINQTRYYKDGQPCYRHTDNISLWKEAAKSVHFPEILIPDTVDIYEGRNIKTIFSLYALAKHLHRMRRVPPIRREDHLQFSPTTMQDARERLKNSDLSLFGNIDEILATTPGDLDAHMKAVMELNNCIGDKKSLLYYLKYPDTGILYVNDALIDKYQKGLKNRTNSLNKNEFLNREQIQSVITEINDAEALKQLEFVLQGKKLPEASELNVILDDLQQEDILRSAGPVYAEELYKIRRNQSAPLTLEQVENILKVVNMCMRVRFYALENDERGMYDALQSEPLGMREIVSPKLKAAYKNRICEEYGKAGKGYLLMSDQLRDIVEQINGEVMQKGQVQNVALACETEDCGSLAEALKGIDGFREELIIHYLKPLKDGKFTTVEEIEIIIRKVNDHTADLQRLHDIEDACKKDDPIALEKALEGLEGVRKDLMAYYLEGLQKAGFSTIADVKEVLKYTNENIAKVEAERQEVQDILAACQKNDPKALAKTLQGISSAAREDLAPYYLEALKRAPEINVDNVEAIIIRINETVEDTKKKVHNIESICQKGDCNSLAEALKDMKDVKAEYLPYYLEALKNGHYITIEEIEEIIEIVNQTIERDRKQVSEILAASKQEDLDSLSKALRPLKHVREVLMPYYQKALKDGQYNTIEEIEKIVIQVNENYDTNKEKVDEIMNACQKGDSKALAHALESIPNVQKGLIPHYMQALKNKHSLTIEEIEEIITEVNQSYELIFRKLNDITSACEQNDLKKLNEALQGIKGVRKDLMDRYLIALRNTPCSTIEEVEIIIAKVNEAAEEDQKRVHDLREACQKDDAKAVLAALHGVPEVREDLLPYYMQALKNAHYTTTDDVIEIIIHINQTIEEVRKKVAKIKTACQKDDLDGLTTLLHDIRGVRSDLIPYYLKALKNAHYTTLEEVEEIIYRTNESVAKADVDKKRLGPIMAACQNEDYDGLLKALHELPGMREEFIPYYMYTLRNRPPISTMDEVRDVIRTVNQDVANAEANSRETVRLNMLLVEGRKDDAADLLKKSWQKVVRKDLLSEYVAWLTEDVVVRKKKWDAKSDSKNSGYLPEQFSEGMLYVNVDDGRIVYWHPDRIVEWMLTREEIEKIIKMMNDKHGSKGKHPTDDKIALQAANKIKRWWRRRLYLKDLKELRTSDKPSLRVVRRFAHLLLHTKTDQKEDSVLEEDRAYATKLVNANRHLEEQLTELDDKFAKLPNNKNPPPEVRKLLENAHAEAEKKISRKITVDKDQLKWNPYEIILFYLQIKPEYFSRLMAKYSDQNVLSDLVRRSVLPVYNYGAGGREMSLMALLLKTYLRGEIKKLNDPIAFRNPQSCIIVQILMELYGKSELERAQLAELNKKLSQKENRVEHFNLNPESIFESVTGNKPKNVDEAMGNATVAKVLNDSKQFLAKWATTYADVIYGSTSEYPDIVRYLAVSAKEDLKERFPEASDDVLMQAIGAWLYKGCWEKEITAGGTTQNENDKENEDSGLPIRRVISKFIEYGILHFGYGVEKYWMNSLNETIGKINSLSKQHLAKVVMQKPPVYKYDAQDELTDKYGSHRPVLHIAMPQLHVTQKRLQNNVTEVVLDKNSRLHKLIADTLPPDDKAEYVTLYLHPFSNDGTDSQENLFQRTTRYVEQCLLSGCPGNNITQLLARHTQQKEEDNFQLLPRKPDDQPTLEDTKRHIVQHMSSLEKAGRVSSVNNYQDIVNAIAKDINQEHSYRKNREAELAILRRLIVELEKARSDFRKHLAAYDDYLNKINRQGSAAADSDGEKKPRLVQRCSTRKQHSTMDKLIKNGIVTKIKGYPVLKGCEDITLEIATTEQPGILLFKISEPSKQAMFRTEMDYQQLSRAAIDSSGTVNIADKVTANAQKLVAYINETIYAKKE